jgi:hypothetical protein
VILYRVHYPFPIYHLTEEPIHVLTFPTLAKARESIGVQTDIAYRNDFPHLVQLADVDGFLGFRIYRIACPEPTKEFVCDLVNRGGVLPAQQPKCIEKINVRLDDAAPDDEPEDTEPDQGDEADGSQQATVPADNPEDNTDDPFA